VGGRGGVPISQHPWRSMINGGWRAGLCILKIRCRTSAAATTPGERDSRRGGRELWTRTSGGRRRRRHRRGIRNMGKVRFAMGSGRNRTQHVEGRAVACVGRMSRHDLPEAVERGHRPCIGASRDCGLHVAPVAGHNITESGNRSPCTSAMRWAGRPGLVYDIGCIGCSGSYRATMNGRALKEPWRSCPQDGERTQRDARAVDGGSAGGSVPLPRLPRLTREKRGTSCLLRRQGQ